MENTLASAIVIGTLLGDGSVYKPSVRKGEAQLRLGYMETSLPYLQWLREQLLSLVEMNPILPKKGYKQFYCWSRPSQALAEYRNLFYPSGKKVVPKTINELLVHPAALAVWYMDDGSIDDRPSYHRNITLATYGFSFPDCRRLCSVLKSNFGIVCNVHRSTMRNKTYPKIYVLSESTDRFLELVKPYIQPCFAYKLGSASSRGNT